MANENMLIKEEMNMQPSELSPAAAGPMAAHERIAIIDILRGFALFGILLVNMALFKAPAIMQATATSAASLADQIAAPATAEPLVLQVLWSGWWLSRFQFGPMEWLWRTLTYGRAQPVRRQAQPAAIYRRGEA